MTLIPNYFNNVSLAPYIDSSTLPSALLMATMSQTQLRTAGTSTRSTCKMNPTSTSLSTCNNPPSRLRFLQNGTMRWLGQNMQLTTQTLPIPPIPVKAIHVNQTINGVNQEVPFQIEDWASNYQIPLGLTSNTTLFGNRQMIVFLLNSKVSDFTVWWNGSDISNPDAVWLSPTNTSPMTTLMPQTLTNGNITLLIRRL